MHFLTHSIICTLTYLHTYSFTKKHLHSPIDPSFIQQITYTIIYIFILSSISSYIHLLLLSITRILTDIFNHPYILLIPLFIHSYLLTHTLTHTVTDTLSHLYAHSSLLTHSFIHSMKHSLLYSFNHSLIHKHIITQSNDSIISSHSLIHSRTHSPLLYTHSFVSLFVLKFTQSYSITYIHSLIVYNYSYIHLLIVLYAPSYS